MTTVHTGSSVPDPLRAWVDSRADDGDKDILARVLSEKLDVAYGLVPAAGVRARLERPRIPIYETTPCQILTRPDLAPAGEPAWSHPSANWLSTASFAAKVVLSGPLPEGDEPGCVYRHFDGRSCLRSSPLMQAPEVTMSPLGELMPKAMLRASAGISSDAEETGSSRRFVAKAEGLPLCSYICVMPRPDDR